jgi:hypothetical protein
LIFAPPTTPLSELDEQFLVSDDSGDSPHTAHATKVPAAWIALAQIVDMLGSRLPRPALLRGSTWPRWPYAAWCQWRGRGHRRARCASTS